MVGLRSCVLRGIAENVGVESVPQLLLLLPELTDVAARQAREGQGPVLLFVSHALQPVPRTRRSPSAALYSLAALLPRRRCRVCRAIRPAAEDAVLGLTAERRLRSAGREVLEWALVAL
jgi:hypothetical protein